MKMWRDIWKGLKVGLEYWPEILLTGSAVWCWVSLMRLLEM